MPALIDELTGLLQPRRLGRCCSAARRPRCARYGSTAAVLALELDDDTAGDGTRACARRSRSAASCGPATSSRRLGAGAFAVLLLECDRATAVRVCASHRARAGARGRAGLRRRGVARARRAAAGRRRRGRRRARTSRRRERQASAERVIGSPRRSAPRRPARCWKNSDGSVSSSSSSCGPVGARGRGRRARRRGRRSARAHGRRRARQARARRAAGSRGVIVSGAKTSSCGVGARLEDRRPCGSRG